MASAHCLHRLHPVEGQSGTFGPIFQVLRSPAGEAMVLEHNIFVEVYLRRSMLRTLIDGEVAYRRPFAEPGKRRRYALIWSRQIPIDGEQSAEPFSGPRVTL
jgi:hypothetical protein